MKPWMEPRALSATPACDAQNGGVNDSPSLCVHTAQQLSSLMTSLLKSICDVVARMSETRAARGHGTMALRSWLRYSGQVRSARLADAQ